MFDKNKIHCLFTSYIHIYIYSSLFIYIIYIYIYGERKKESDVSFDSEAVTTSFSPIRSSSEVVKKLS